MCQNLTIALAKVQIPIIIDEYHRGINETIRLIEDRYNWPGNE